MDVATAGERCWVEGGGGGGGGGGGDRAAAVVVMRLRGGGEQQRDRAEQATADRGVVGSREGGEEAGREGYGSWVVCVVCNRGGSAWWCRLAHSFVRSQRQHDSCAFAVGEHAPDNVVLTFTKDPFPSFFSKVVVCSCSMLVDSLPCRLEPTTRLHESM